MTERTAWVKGAGVDGCGTHTPIVLGAADTLIVDSLWRSSSEVAGRDIRRAMREGDGPQLDLSSACFPCSAPRVVTLTLCARTRGRGGAGAVWLWDYYSKIHGTIIVLGL